MAVMDGVRDDPTRLGETLLAEIFKRLPFEERLTIVPLVCKTWRDASHDPTCWRNVDMNGWFKHRAEEDFMWEFEFECEDEMEFYIKKVVDRSCGQLTELQTMHCSDSAIEYLAEKSPNLTDLSIRDSPYATEHAVKKLAENCKKLQKLDLSDCYNVGNETLEAFGSNCKSLVWLARNMVRTNDFLSAGPLLDGDDEATILSQHLPNLKHLEMKKSSLSDVGLSHLAKGCPQLESLNLACCTLSPYALEQVPKFCAQLKEFVKPIVPRMHVNPKFLMVLFD
ncbi:unnamed protein product [Calypogeia fissa]